MGKLLQVTSQDLLVVVADAAGFVVVILVAVCLGCCCIRCRAGGGRWIGMTVMRRKDEFS